MQRSEFKFFLTLSIRWGDMDALRHVNNVQFFRYLESGRIAYLEHLNEYVDDALKSIDYNVILADIQCSFKQQLHYPATVEVGIRTARFGNRSFDLLGAIYRQGESAPVATAKAVLVWFDFTTQRPSPLPDWLRTTIKAYETVTPLG